MSAHTHLPNSSLDIALEQGWDDDSIVIHLAGFIASKGLNDDLARYLAKVAKEENDEASAFAAEPVRRPVDGMDLDYGIPMDTLR